MKMDVYAEPEVMIAELNRKRQLKVFAAVGGLTLALGALLFAAAAMYNQEPEAAQTPAVEVKALQPAR
jgi:uncharacterized membrane protein